MRCRPQLLSVVTISLAAACSSLRAPSDLPSPVELGKVIKTEDSLSVRVPLEKALVPGTYLVNWRSVSKDGHAVRGSYHFNMLPGPPVRKQAGQ